MKTKDLIAQLQENDPTGEVECVVGGIDIHFVERMPGFYDGCYQVLIKDKPNQYPTGVKIMRSGEKVMIHTLSASDLIFDAEDVEVIIDPQMGEFHTIRYQNLVAKWRQEAIDINNDVERSHFVRWAKGHGFEESVSAAFWSANYTYRTPLPEDLKPMQGKSWNECREIQWDREGVIHKMRLKP